MSTSKSTQLIIRHTWRNMTLIIWFVTDIAAVSSSSLISVQCIMHELMCVVSFCFICSQSALVCDPPSAKRFHIMNMLPNFCKTAYFFYHCISLSVSVWGFYPCWAEQQAEGCSMNAICCRSCMLILSVMYHSGNMYTVNIDCSCQLQICSPLPYHET